MTTNTAMRAMLLIARSPGEKPLKGWLSAVADITKPYPINQLPEYYEGVKRGMAGGKASQMYANMLAYSGCERTPRDENDETVWIDRGRSSRNALVGDLCACGG